MVHVAHVAQFAGEEWFDVKTQSLGEVTSSMNDTSGTVVAHYYGLCG